MVACLIDSACCLKRPFRKRVTAPLKRVGAAAWLFSLGILPWSALQGCNSKAENENIAVTVCSPCSWRPSEPQPGFKKCDASPKLPFLHERCKSHAIRDYGLMTSSCDVTRRRRHGQRCAGPGGSAIASDVQKTAPNVLSVR